MTDTNRAAALAKLATLGVKPDLSSAVDAPEPAVTIRDEDAIYAGGDVERVLIGPAHLTYRDEDKQLLHAFAEVGNTVLLTDAQAKRLDGLGVTVTKAKAKKLATEPAPEPAPAATSASAKTDEELAAMKAPELIAHVNQHPGDKVRVRAMEGAREEPRVTVLKATAPDGDDADEELDDDEE